MPWRPNVPRPDRSGRAGSCVTHLLVTNDFPPKIGGIQSYLHELWRRLPPEEVTILTGASPDAAGFDARQGFGVRRWTRPVLLPTPGLVREVRRVAAEIRAGLVVIDPALPLGLIGPRLDLPYAIVLHGAEVTVPGRLPGGHGALRSVLAGAALAIAAGGYPAAEAERVAGDRMPRTVLVPPGVDHRRFRPLDDDERLAARSRLGLPLEGMLVVSVSRLVPRKGFDVLIEAVGRLGPSRPGLTLAIAGTGRDRPRLERLARRVSTRVRFLGRVPDEELALLNGAADVFAMCCRNRWLGLEQEGFGIVFLEAAAAGVAQVAGRSGGAGEAVAEGETGLVVDHPDDPVAVAGALARLLDDAALRARLGAAARQRAIDEFDYDVLAGRLHAALVAAGG